MRIRLRRSLVACCAAVTLALAGIVLLLAPFEWEQAQRRAAPAPLASLPAGPALAPASFVAPLPPPAAVPAGQAPEVAPTQPKRSATPATPRRVVPASSEDLRSRLYGEPGGATAQLRLLDVFVAHASPDRAQDALEGLIEQPLDGDDRGRVLRDGTILRLGALGSPGADAFLLALAATTESPATDRIAALQSLASRGVGEDAEPVVRAIALRDEEPVVRRAAERVLEVSTRLAVASRDGARARPPR